MVQPALGAASLCLLIFLLTGCRCRGFHVELRAPRYVSFGNSALLKCDYSVSEDELHKVEWLHQGRKIWQYVKGRSPPYRNYTTLGSIIDLSLSDRHQVLLTNLNFDASGIYTCEVSTETPIIYTKPSEELEITVIKNQMEEPRITFRKPEYSVGDWLQVNCTSASARPTPDVTWLINGKKVDEGLIRSFTDQVPSTVTAQLTLQLTEEHVDGIELTCLATIPKYLGNEVHQSEYADHKAQSVKVSGQRGPSERVRRPQGAVSQSIWATRSIRVSTPTTRRSQSKYLGNEVHQSEYADHKAQSVKVSGQRGPSERVRRPQGAVSQRGNSSTIFISKYLGNEVHRSEYADHKAQSVKVSGQRGPSERARRPQGAVSQSIWATRSIGVSTPTTRRSQSKYLGNEVHQIEYADHKAQSVKVSGQRGPSERARRPQGAVSQSIWATRSIRASTPTTRRSQSKYLGNEVHQSEHADHKAQSVKGK
ncbi:uncharacterized protein LOC128988464 [Macrosteles quadrilineatus]|uniref:uncharacterized protein LOC128988464 n=1 Tax=Macrosteles quadrilineatus TaxID=74068 RepID=UPI0023E16DEF|nr:uncharacterized protein LOC128988464 [Macrosteles quadrilineatus]